jgi:hypothetical protein
VTFTAAFLRTLALAFWFGGGLATFLATSAVFQRAPDRKVAGDLAGAILARTGLARSVAVALLVIAVLLGARGGAVDLGIGCAVLQALAVGADLETRKTRRAAGGSIDALPPGDPLRRRFAALHGVAMLVLLLQVLTAGVGLALAS